MKQGSRGDPLAGRGNPVGKGRGYVMKERDEERAWEEYKIMRNTIIVMILAFFALFVTVGFAIGDYLYHEIAAPLWLSILVGILTPLLLFLKLVCDMGASIHRHLE